MGTADTQACDSANKLGLMAQQLTHHKLQGYYIPPEDEHLNEYLPENKQRIQWLTGFSGESAPLLVLQDALHLYVDGRFHIQVDDEVDPSCVKAHKLPPDLSGEKAMIQTLTQQFENQAIRLGYDPFIVSPARLKRLQAVIPSSLNVEMVPVSGNLVDPLWSDRPLLPAKQAYSIGVELTGKSVEAKLNEVRDALSKHGAEVLAITRLDDIAWLFNLRAADIPYNPVLEAYAIVTATEVMLFAQPEKLSASLQQHLSNSQVQYFPYSDYTHRLQSLLSQKSLGVLVDKDSLTMGTLAIIEANGTVIEKENPVTHLKAIKNPTEIEKMQLANFRASRAIIRHLAFVDKAFGLGTRFSEWDARQDLEAKYQQEPEFVDLSFPTIPGIGTNSAIIHYSHADANNIGQDGDFYLLDSGCQYLGGTTDTTRTTVFGTPKSDQIRQYTYVLKAHIACAKMVFPQGTKGIQLDAVCRAPMWEVGLDFAHGTGHGVGAFLNVHEGPNRISKACNVVFEPGMVTSIEPGYYLKDWGGIRLENLYTVVEDTEKPGFLGKPWYRFESFAWVPFERKLIDPNLLDRTEREWLKGYYQKILEKLLPTLSPDEQAWLNHQCGWVE